MKSNIKFYIEESTTSDFNYEPFFCEKVKLSPTWRERYYTYNIEEADFISFVFPRNHSCNVLELYNRIKELKENSNKKFKLLLCWKDELIQEDNLLYKLSKMCVENGLFTKEEILAVSPNINNIEYDYFIHSPFEYWPSHYFYGNSKSPNGRLKDDLYPDDDGRYFGTKRIQKEKVERTKKIISSARKWNPFRGSFYDELLKDYKHLINDDNIIRFYSLLANDKHDKIHYYDLFSHNHSLEELSAEKMMWEEERFYESIVGDYMRSYFTIVHETVFPDYKEGKYFNQYHIGEKTGIPCMTKTIFFHNTYDGFSETLNKIGMKTYNEFFNTDNLLEICDTINNMSFKEIENFYNQEKVQEYLEHNYNFINKWFDLDYTLRKYKDFIK